jgi:DNA-binding MarR family transcriptional regulator
MSGIRSAKTRVRALSELALAVFRAHGALIARGDALVGPVQLTSARWQVLGAVALAGGALTVPGIAHTMGLTRQAIQKQVDVLKREGLVSTRSNPAHKRSVLVELTAPGRVAYARADRRWSLEAARLSEGLSASSLKSASNLLERLTARLSRAENEKQRGNR